LGTLLIECLQSPNQALIIWNLKNSLIIVVRVCFATCFTLCIVVFAFVVFYKDDTLIRLLIAGMMVGVIFLLGMRIHVSKQQLVIQSPISKNTLRWDTLHDEVFIRKYYRVPGEWLVLCTKEDEHFTVMINKFSNHNLEVLRNRFEVKCLP
jgi:hypothetical protein